MPRGCGRRRSRICSPCSTATARRRASSAARCATRCWASRSAKSTLPPPRCRPEVIRRARGGGLQGGADRDRARHRHRGRPRAAVRGHDPARGRRDLRAPCEGGVRPRLETRCRAPRLHHERAVGRARRHGLRLCRRARRRRGAARALHRRRRHAHRRRLSAHPAFLSLSCRLWRGRARPGRACRLHRRARRPRPIVARARPHGADQAAARQARGADARRDDGSQDCSIGCSAACRCSPVMPT